MEHTGNLGQHEKTKEQQQQEKTKTYLQIAGINEGKDSQINGIDHIFNKHIKENFPKLKTHTYTDIRST